jgi:hypothetical protein
LQDYVVSHTIFNTKRNIPYNSIEDYIYRGVEFKDMCWYDYATLMRSESTASLIEFHFVKDHRMYGKRGMIRRDVQVIPTIYGSTPRQPNNESSQIDIDSYNEAIAILFMPFSNLAELLQKLKEHEYNPRHTRLINNIELLHKSSDECSRRKIQQRIDDNATQLTPEMMGDPCDADHENIDVNFQNDIELNDDITDNFNLSDIFPEYRIVDSKYKSVVDTFDTISKDLNRLPFKNDYTVTELNPIAQDVGWTTHFETAFLNLIDAPAQPTTLESHDKAAETFILKPTTPADVEPFLIRCMEHLPLNACQEKAFRYIGSHIMLHDSEKLIFYVGGEGGTGKSRIINAITMLMEITGHITKLKKMALTGTAAYNIGGRTVHSSLKKSPNKKTAKSVAAMDALRKVWQNVTVTIVDEISFLPGNLLDDLDEVLKSAHDSKLDFGDTHIIMFGDFKQHISIATKIYDSKSWKLIKKTIILTEQMRAQKDPRFIEFLGNVRERNITERDVVYLNESLYDPAKFDLMSDEWFNAQCIIPRKELCFIINSVKAFQFSKKFNTRRIIISAWDTCQGRQIQNSGIKQQIILKHTCPGSNSNFYRIIELCIGSRVVLTSNIKNLDQYGLTNGISGIVVGLVPFNSRDIDHKYYPNHNLSIYSTPPILLFKPDKLDSRLSNFSYSGLDVGVFPIYPHEETFKIKLLAPSQTMITSTIILLILIQSSN